MERDFSRLEHDGRSPEVPGSAGPGPSWLLLAGVGALGAAAWLATAEDVRDSELRIYRIFNRLPARLEVPLAATMQLGSLAAVPASAGAALVARRPTLAADLAVSGGTSWLAAKVVKRIVRRERPAALVTESLLRGRPQTGLGFPSGHTAVAAALATAAGPWLTPAARLGAWASVATVAIARMYVGAHLPVDAIGGVAMGSLIATSVHAWRRVERPERR